MKSSKLVLTATALALTALSFPLAEEASAAGACWQFTYVTSTIGYQQSVFAQFSWPGEPAIIGAEFNQDTSPGFNGHNMMVTDTFWNHSTQQVWSTSLYSGGARTVKGWLISVAGC